MVDDDVELHLLWYKNPVKEELAQAENVRLFKVDLSDASGLEEGLSAVDTVVHFAGMLFRLILRSFCL